MPFALRDASLAALGLETRMELWHMRPDGSEQQQITHMDGWEPGGAF